MNCLEAFSPESKTLDPRKRVNYVLGLVLGVDEFNQEQTYFLHKHRSHHRLLHGYGTVCGLEVRATTTSGAVNIIVAPGEAVNPAGHDICVTPAQCADFTEWVGNNLERLDLPGSLPPEGADRSVYLVLCSRECKTDQVPLPGKPCRTEQESIAPSRIKEDFELKFTTEAPSQVEEDAIRCFGELLCRIEISAEAAEYLDRDTLIALVDECAPLETPSGLALPSDPGLPSGAGTYYLHPDTACEDLRAAFRHWVTVVRPYCCEGDAERCILLAEIKFHLAAIVPSLAISDVTLDESQRPFMLQTRLLQEWLLCAQKAGNSDKAGDNTFATIFVTAPRTLRVWVHHEALIELPAAGLRLNIEGAAATIESVTRAAAGVNVFDVAIDPEGAAGSFGHKQMVELQFLIDQITLSAPPHPDLFQVIDQADYDYVSRTANVIFIYTDVELPALGDLTDVNTADAAEGDLLVLDGGVWVPKDTKDAIDHGEIGGLKDDDHTHYLLVKRAVDPKARSLLYNLNADNHKVIKLAPATVPGDAVPYEQAIKQGDPAGGDLAGFYPDPKVRQLQGRPVAALPNPVASQVLTWTGSEWAPMNAAGGGGLTLEEVAMQLRNIPFVTIERLPLGPKQEVPFQLWFHLEPAEKNDLHLLPLDGVRVLAETNAPAPFWQELRITNIYNGPQRNVWVVAVEIEALQFEFLRFVFDLRSMNAEDSGGVITPLAELVKLMPVKWLGHDGDSTVTQYYHNQRNLGNEPKTVAAGTFVYQNQSTLKPLSAFGGIAAAPVSGAPSDYVVHFSGYTPGQGYLVNGVPISPNIAGTPPLEFEVIDLMGKEGITLRIHNMRRVKGYGFSAEIKVVPAG